MPPVCFPCISSLCPHANMYFHLRRCRAWGCKNKLDLCAYCLWRLSGATGSSLAVNKLSVGCIYPWIILLFSSIQILWWPVIWASSNSLTFTFILHSGPQVCNKTEHQTNSSAPHFTGESLNYSVYCFNWSYVSVYLDNCEHVLCWWKPHFPLRRVKNPRSLDPEHPSACAWHEHYPSGARQLQQYQTGDKRESGGERERESKDANDREKEGEKEEVIEVLFLSFQSRVSAWMEAKKQRRIVLKGARTQIIS